MSRTKKPKLEFPEGVLMSFKKGVLAEFKEDRLYISGLKTTNGDEAALNLTYKSLTDIINTAAGEDVAALKVTAEKQRQRILLLEEALRNATAALPPKKRKRNKTEQA